MRACQKKHASSRVSPTDKLFYKKNLVRNRFVFKIKKNKVQKMKFISIALLFLVASCANGYSIAEYEEFMIELAYNDSYVAEYEKTVRELVAEDPNYFDYTPFGTPGFTFDCNVTQFKSRERPTSVHALRPGDINVVGSMGDSITAACGEKARTILGLLLEFRGQSWSIGGKSKLEKVVTLPNVLKRFNSNLRGFNTKPSVLLTKGVGFNAAISGSTADDMLDQVFQNRRENLFIKSITEIL
jgi:hypothetical protein